MLLIKVFKYNENMHKNDTLDEKNICIYECVFMVNEEKMLPFAYPLYKDVMCETSVEK